MICAAEKLIAVAVQEIGYKEKKSNASLQDKTANTGNANFNKYAADIDKNHPNFYNYPKNGYEWCDIFVDWCFIKAFGEADAKRLLCQPDKSCGAGCSFSKGYYQSKGRISKTPAIGAQIFFKVNGGVNHTGIVTGYDNAYVYTIEGNTDNMVARRTYSLNDAKIDSYGIPDYDKEEQAGVKQELIVDVDKTKYSTVILNIT